MSSPTPVLAPSVGPPRHNAGAWLALGLVIVGLVAAAIAGFLLFGPSGVAPPVPPHSTLRTRLEPAAPARDRDRTHALRARSTSRQRAAPVARDPATRLARRVLQG